MALVVSGLCVIALAFTVSGGTGALYLGGLTVIGLLCSLMVLGALFAGEDFPVVRMLASRPFTAVGRWSYSLYLWHFPIFYLLHVHQPTWNPLARTALGWALAFTAAVASYRFVERPFLGHNNPHRPVTTWSWPPGLSRVLGGCLVLLGETLGGRHERASRERDRIGVVVVGGGLAGLAAAAYAARAGTRVILFEAREELGGRARSDEDDGFTFNQGAHALYRGGAECPSSVSSECSLAGHTPRQRSGQWLHDGQLTSFAHVEPIGGVRGLAMVPQLLSGRIGRAAHGPVGLRLARVAGASIGTALRRDAHTHQLPTAVDFAHRTRAPPSTRSGGRRRAVPRRRLVHDDRRDAACRRRLRGRDPPRQGDGVERTTDGMALDALVGAPSSKPARSCWPPAAPPKPVTCSARRSARVRRAGPRPLDRCGPRAST